MLKIIWNVCKKKVIKIGAKKKFVRKALPPSSEIFRLNPHSQLVIGYHWLTFLNHVCKQSKSQFTRNFEHKFDHILKTKILKISSTFISEHCSSYGTKNWHFWSIILVKILLKFWEFWVQNDHISKNKFGFFIRFRTLLNFLDQKPNFTTYEEEEGGGGGSAST